MELSPDYKREIKRLFTKQPDIALSIHKGTDTEETIEKISEITKISVPFLNQNIKDLRTLAFSL